MTDFSRALKGLDGKPIKAQGKDVTLGSVSADALLAPEQQANPREPAPKIPGTEKVKRYELAKKVYKGGKVDVKAEDIALLKKVIAANYSALVVGQAWAMLEKKK